MNQKSVWLRIFFSIIPSFFLFLNLSDIMDVWKGGYGYPFGSEFFSPNSIYRSRNFYIGFVLFSIIFLAITLFLIWKQKWNWLLIVVLIDIAFLAYPFFTMDE